MRPRAHVLTVGNEVLKGTVLNTNARFLGRELTGLGFEVIAQSSCRDVIPEISRSLDQALSDAELVILSGGLGPTPDDLTREAVSELFGMPLEFSKQQFDFIKKYYQKRNQRIPSIVKKEALFPSGAKPLFNRFGIALGFYIWKNKKMTVVLPGVPFELEKMFAQLVIPVLAQYFPRIAKRFSLVVRTVGLSEPAVMKKLGKDFFSEIFDFGIYPHPGETTLRIYAENKRVITRLAAKAKQRLSGFVYAWDETSLAQTIGLLLQKKKNMLAVAESCTGGLLSSLITQSPGASAYYRGGLIAYHRDLKKWLGVDEGILQRGVISDSTARELAEKAREVLVADYGIGITGVAGPGKEENISAGRVYIAVASAAGTVVHEESFMGERIQIQMKAAVKALELFWKTIVR